ncbi:MAG: hypothetical protein IJ776_00965 [Paludibacteraceae bacterium]|nr:hypothetical protein [Paludibacteraceae bacterium]
MKKTLLSVLSLALCFSLFAQDEVTRYFFSPSGQGEEDGSSWENAAPGEYLGATIANAEPGTEIYLMEGSYAPDVNTNKWTIPQGILLKGGYPTTMTGTKTSYNYALGGQSVFSADLDGDGKGDNTDYAFVYIGDGDPTEKSEAYYKDWQMTEIWGITFRDGMRLNSKYWGNMVFVQAAKADFHFCRFFNNDSQTNDDTNGSNGAIEIWGSQVRCYDCIFRDNVTAKGSGAAFQVRARQSNSSVHGPEDNAIAYFERCEFRNNIAYSTLTSEPGNEKWGTYGGTCSVADNGGTVYFVNCLIADSKCWYRGVGIRVGGNNTAYFINSTFFNNPCRSRTNRGSNNGSAVSAGTDSKNYFAGNIMVEYAENDDFTSSDAVVYIQTAGTAVYSAGYNILGTVMNNSTVENSGFLATDNIPLSAETVNTIEKVFGTNAIGNQGGVSDVVAPLDGVGAMTLKDVKDVVATWPIDECAKAMDLDKDQRGYTRAEATVSGSYDKNGTAPIWEDDEPETALYYINSEKAFGKGIYTVLGQYMGEDLNALPAGLYIQDGKKVAVK